MRSILAAALAISMLTPVHASTQEADLLLRHATIVDVEHARLITDQAVVTTGNKIVAVGKDAGIAQSWSARQTIDTQGRYLIPGLWDMHVHFGGGSDAVEENKALLPLYVALGITTIRDCAGDIPYDVLSWRDEIAIGKLLGPNLLSSGPKIEGLKPVWKGTLETGSSADVDAAIEKLKGLHVDFVKITDSTLEPDLFLYAVRQAHAAGLKTSGHIPMQLTVEQAVDAGLNSIEHLDYAFKAGVKNERAIAREYAAGRIDRAEANRQLDAGFDQATAMSAYRQLARKGVFVTPTLNGNRILAWLDRDHHEQDEGSAYIGPKLRKTYEWRVQRAAKDDDAAIAQRHARYDRVAAVLPMLQKAGVAIMAGTDAGFLNSFNYPAFGLQDELTLYVEKGLTPAQALSSATRAGPAWFGKLDQYGSINQGKAADLVLLDINPLADINATRAIRLVVLRGKVFDRDQLNQILTDARTKVAAWNATPPVAAQQSQPPASATSAALAIVGGTLIDGTGNPPRANITIHIEQGRIKSITPSTIAPRPDELVIDTHGRFVLPGLIDANSHATLYGQPQRSDTLLKYGDRGEDLAIEFTQRTLKYGVTTIRDSYGILPVDIAARTAIERGERIGSRLLAAGNIIGWGGTYSLTFSMTRADAVPRQRGLELTPFQGYWNDLITQGTGEDLTDLTPDQLRVAIDRYLDKGPDFIKYGGTAHFLRPTLIGFSLEQQRAIVEEAHRRGKKVDVHATSPEGLRLSVEAGIDLIQHADLLSQDYPDDLVKLIQKRKPICSMMSNLTTGRLWTDYQAQRAGADAKYARMPPPATTAERNTRRETVGLYGDAIEYQRRNTTRLIKAGCLITVGTDAAIFDAPEFRTGPTLTESSPGIATQRAIEGLVELGMTPMQALVAATRNGGIATNIPDLGTIEPGKLADVLVLDADPLQDIHNIEKVNAVIARGRLIDTGRLPERPVFKE